MMAHDGTIERDDMRTRMVEWQHQNLVNIYKYVVMCGRNDGIYCRTHAAGITLQYVCV